MHLTYSVQDANRFNWPKLYNLKDTKTEKLRFFLLPLMVFAVTKNIWSQPYSPSNSFAHLYKESNPSLHYQYDSLRQIHNYSDNWDFDKDGKPDQLYFVGTGGAHLYFYLRVILSTDNLVRNYPFIQSDFPVLPSDEEVNTPGFSPEKNMIQFAVFSYDNDKQMSIFIRLDKSSFAVEKRGLRKRGIKTKLIVLSFKNTKTIFKDFHYKTK